MAYIRNARSVLGIPVNYNQPSQYISAAYDLLCAGKPITTSECNRYILHKQAADNGREILLELEVLEHNDSSPGGALETWLDLAESKIEGYRTAYRSLTGVDLGIPGAKIEQQA
jgi:hypothetical protein